MTWGSTRCVVLYPFPCGRRRLQITLCWCRCELGFTILWSTWTFGQLWQHCGYCSTYYERKEYYNAKNPTSSKRAFYNSSKLWFCFKRFLVQIYSDLLVYLHVFHFDGSKILRVGLCEGGGIKVWTEHDYYFKSDSVKLTLGYSLIVMSVLFYGYSLCVNKYEGTIVGGQSRVQEPSLS